MNRHYKIQTAAGTEDILCIEKDDSNDNEIWFIFIDFPPRIFQRSAVISLQEILPKTDEQERLEEEIWDRCVAGSQNWGVQCE